MKASQCSKGINFLSSDIHYGLTLPVPMKSLLAGSYGVIREGV